MTEVMTLLDKFAMELATDLEKQGSSNGSNATVEVKMDNIGEFETRRLDSSLLKNKCKERPLLSANN